MPPSNLQQANGPTPRVYVYSSEHAWVPARLLSSNGQDAVVAVEDFRDAKDMMSEVYPNSRRTKHRKETVSLRSYPNHVLPMQNVDDSGSLKDYEDMVNLPYLHEAAILYNIKHRHINGKPYSRTGDMIVAVNPYQWHDHLYTDRQKSAYSKRLVWECSESDPRAFLAPHVYETSALAYKGMAFDGHNQSILVSGESGAGKTETVKICMDHIASIQQGPYATGSAKEGTSLVISRILDSSPLLEAFGNAKTRRNDNSSRFGKYTQLQFDSSGGVGRHVSHLVGSKSEVYLLEKNRVVSHDDEERGFHIFYQLLAADGESKRAIWPELAKADNETFKYVGPTATNSIEGVSDSKRFMDTMHALKRLGLPEDDIRSFFRAICMVLLLGNLAFNTHESDDDISIITSSSIDELGSLSKLMGISEADLILALTERTMQLKSKDGAIKVPLNAAVAKESADAFAKEIYGNLFLWLVDAINTATCAEKTLTVGDRNKRLGTIGLLDIFGFEAFQVNRFEQLCINYANEKLQQKFTEDIFRSVQMEYEAEGIPLAEITYDDNSDVLDLIEGRHSGLCALLNEECVRPKGSGEVFVSKAISQHQGSPCFIVHKTDRTSFGIHHYAGKVLYHAENFVTRNNDTLPTDLITCAANCSNAIVAGAFRKMQIVQPSGKQYTSVKRNRSNIVAPTVWTKYRNQLSNLMTNLRETNSRYIRCIKPNSMKKPGLMDHKLAVEQLRNAGIAAAVTVARSAFPNRLENTVVYARYNSMRDPTQRPPPAGRSNEKLRCEVILTHALKSREIFKDGGITKAFVVGKTRTYFRAGALEYLESQRITGLDTQATTIQRAVRGWLARKVRPNAWKAEKAQRENAAREEQERRVRLEREALIRQARHQQELEGNLRELAEVRAACRQEDERARTRIENANTRIHGAQKGIEDLSEKLDVVAQELARKKYQSAVTQEKLTHNKKMIEYLRKNNKKLQKEREKEESKLEMMRGNNSNLFRTTQDSFSTFEGVHRDADVVTDRNVSLKDRHDATREEHERLVAAINSCQQQYLGVAEQRLELQKAVAQILSIIQDGSKDNDLIQKTFAVAHQCEEESNLEMSSLELSSQPALEGSDVSDGSMTLY